MSDAVFLAVLAAAAMHATWNMLVKRRADRFLSIFLMSVGMGLASLPFAAFVPVPDARTWSWICLSVLCHFGYKFFLGLSYQADLGQSYPLARGTAPLITALGGALLLAEFPPPLALAGIAALGLGTAVLSLRGGTGLGLRPVGYALLTALFIAGYTLTDGGGARTAASPGSYAVWLFIADGAASALLCLAIRGPAAVRAALPDWRHWLATGLLSAAAYWIAIWAMTKAPIASVAALRETSILFAMLLSAFVLGETMTRWRLGAALLIVGGVVALRLS